MAYLGNSPLNKLFSDVARIAGDGQTLFQFSYVPGAAVFLRNGVILDADEVIATNGSSITLATGAVAGDSIRCLSFASFAVAGALPLAGGTLTGPLQLSGDASQALHPVALGQFTGANQSLAASGYQKLPGGLIVQWGSITTSSGGDVGVTFPVSFVSTSRVFMTPQLAASGVFGGVNTLSATGFNANSWSATGTRAAALFYWFAIGY